MSFSTVSDHRSSGGSIRSERFAPAWSRVALLPMLNRRAILEQKEDSWCMDEKAWLRKQTLAMLRERFEVDLAEPVWNLGRELLEAAP